MAYSSYASSSASSSSTPLVNPWQSRLQIACRDAQIGPPQFSLLSDKRGGRTAWSAHVVISGQTIPARYWYDGQYTENAKEDAAECALKLFAPRPSATATPSSSSSSSSRHRHDSYSSGSSFSSRR